MQHMKQHRMRYGLNRSTSAGRAGPCRHALRSAVFVSALLTCVGTQSVPQPGTTFLPQPGVTGTTPVPPSGNNTSGASTCQLTLANNVTYPSLLYAFQRAASTGKVVVYFRLKTQRADGRLTPFSVANWDTFAPDEWIWAVTSGKNLLRMPLDYSVMSLGLLTINTFTMDIVLTQDTEDCLKVSNYSYAAHIVAKFLAENVTANGTTVGLDSDGPVVCRSAFAFDHRLFGEKGVGFRCCAAPVLTGDLYVCQTSYSDSWGLVWYGPVALLLWVYAIAFIHFYKLYRHAFMKRTIRELSGLEQTIDEIKLDIVNRFVAMSRRLARIQDPIDIIALRERCGFLDVLGVDKARQSRVTAVLNVLVVGGVICAYYTACALFIYAYSITISPTLARLNSTQEAFLNVVGHFGWLFCDHGLAIFSYAVFETIYTAAIPLFATIVYVTIAYRTEARQYVEAQGAGQPAQLAGGASPGGCGALLLRAINAPCGRVVQGISFFLCLVYVVFIAGIFVAYVVYFVGLGVFANIAVVSPWVIPLGICVHFFITVFDPATNLYKNIKETFFTICMKSFTELIIKRHKEIFIPRAILEHFYVPRSKPVLYSCLLRIMWVIAFMFLLVLIVLTLQYPYYQAQAGSIVSFLGVQVVFILPLLGQVVLANQAPSSLEQSILQTDMEEYIKKYVKAHPDIVPPPKPKKSESMSRKEGEGADGSGGGGGDGGGGSGGGGGDAGGHEDGEGGDGMELGSINVAYAAGDGINTDALAQGGRRLLEKNGYRSPYT